MPPDQGAARVAAIEKKFFEVRQFLNQKKIESDPDQLYQIFPKPVSDRIKAKLNLK